MPAISIGNSWRLDKLRDDLSRAHAVAEADVVVVEKKRKYPHVVARRFRLLVDRVANRARRFGNRVGILGDVDELEGLNGLRLAVFRNLEIFRLQVMNRIALPIGDDDVDANDVDVGAEDRDLGCGIRWRRRLLLRRRRRGVLCTQPERHRGGNNGRQRNAKQPLVHYVE